MGKNKHFLRLQAIESDCDRLSLSDLATYLAVDFFFLLNDIVPVSFCVYRATYISVCMHICAYTHTLSYVYVYIHTTHINLMHMSKWGLTSLL